MPSLNVLTMLQDGSVLVPDAVMNKFAAGTVEHSMLCEKKKQIEEEFRALGHAVAVAGTVAAPNPGGNRAPRARGRPDWTIEGGLKPQHLEKLVLLEVLPGATFNVNRLATAPGQKSRPTVVVTTDFELYLGNETDMEIQVKNLDIFGFHLGDFESKM
ncbi:FO synthase subunit 1, partial [Durusdinium trenchii]